MQLVDIVSVLATISLLAMLLGPSPAVLQIHKTHSTGPTPLAPLVSLAANGWIWTMYGYLEHNFFPVAVSNFAGFVLGVVYTVVFYRHTHERAYAHKIIGSFSLFLIVATVYAVAGVNGYTNQTAAQVQQGLGFAGVLTVLLFFTSPFENIVLVFRHRSNVFIPILLVSAGAVNSAMWTTYSLLTSDWFIFVPNFSALLIGSTQIALYVYFRPEENRSVELGALGSFGKDLEAASLELLHHRGLGDAQEHVAVSSPRILPLHSPLRVGPSGYGTSAQ